MRNRWCVGALRSRVACSGVGGQERLRHTGGGSDAAMVAWGRVLGATNNSHTGIEIVSPSEGDWVVGLVGRDLGKEGCSCYGQRSWWRSSMLPNGTCGRDKMAAVVCVISSATQWCGQKM